MLIPVILSGGAGTRLWPVSRQAFPKPFMKLSDGDTLLSKTLKRAIAVAVPGAVYTVTNRDHYFLTRDAYAPLIDELYREEVLDARRMSPLEKLLLGEELFEYACSITLDGIRNQNPGFSEEDCHRELDRRLALRERMDQQERWEQRG